MDLEKSFFNLKRISLNKTNLCIAIRSKNSFLDLKKFLDYLFFFELKRCLRSRQYN